MHSGFVSAALVQRLRTISGIDEEDVQSIRVLPVSIKHYRANQPIVRDGERPTECCLVAEGFCVRTKTTSSGQRQILSIHIPGEIPDLQSLHLHVMDHDLVTLTECTLGFFSHSSLREITRRRAEHCRNSVARQPGRCGLVSRVDRECGPAPGFESASSSFASVSRSLDGSRTTGSTCP